MLLFNLCHVYNISRLAKFVMLEVLSLTNRFEVEEKLDTMMAEFRDTKRELEQKFSSSLNEFKQEINAAREKTVQQFSKKIGSFTYEFWRKGNEHQFNFNCGIEDAIDSAKSELSMIKATNSDTKEAVKRAEMSSMKLQRHLLSGRSTSR